MTEPEQTKDLSKRPEWLALLAVLALTVLTFSGSLVHGGFVYDDLDLVKFNPRVREEFSLRETFSQPFWDAVDPMSRNRVPYYRPLVSLAFHAGYQLSGSQPWGYHAVNLILHLVSTAAVFYLLREFLGGSLAGAFAGALLFGLHSVHTESVAWISGVSDTSAIAFGLWAWVFFLRAARTGKLYLAWIACPLLAAGLFAKEIAVLIIPMILLSMLLRWVAAFARRHWLTSAGVLGLPLLLWYGVRVAVFESWDAAIGKQVVDNHAGLSAGRLIALPFEFLGHYIVLLFNPAARAEFHVFRSGATFSDPTLLLHVILGAGTLAIALLLVLSRGLGTRRRPIALAPWIAILGLAPILVTFNALGQFTVSERYLYLPSVGLCLALGVLVAWIAAARAPLLRHSWVVLLVPVLFLGWITFNHARIYDSERAFYEDAVERSPACAVAHLGLGRVYLDEAEALKELNPDEARRLIDKALDRFYSVSSIFTDREFYYVAFQEAFAAGKAQFGAYLLKASLEPPGAPREEAYRYAETMLRDLVMKDMRAFQARIEKEDPAKAALVEEALDSPDFLVNQGWLAHGLGRYQEAIALCRKALDYNPYFFDAFYALAVIHREHATTAQELYEYDRLLTSSIEYCRRALRIQPLDMAAQLLLSRDLVDRGVGRINMKKNLSPEEMERIYDSFEEADEILSSARRRNPEIASLYLEHAFLKVWTKRHAEAADLLEQAVILSDWSWDCVEKIVQFYIKLGQPRTALNFLFAMREKYPDSIAAQINLVRYLLLVRETEQSAKEILKLREMDPRGWESYGFEAYHAFMMVENERAYEAYEEALKRAPLDAHDENVITLYKEAAKFFMTMGRGLQTAAVKAEDLSPEARGRVMDRGARVYGKGVQLMQRLNGQVLWWEYGEMLGKAHRFGEAVEALQKALRVELEPERRTGIQNSLEIFQKLAEKEG